MDDRTIKEDFHILYESMNGMTLQEMDPIHALCCDHQRSGFIEGIRVGTQLREKLTEK